MSDKTHWEGIYAHKPANEVSWYRPHLDVSLDLIREIGLKRDARIIDVGGGASTLVDDLIDLRCKLTPRLWTTDFRVVPTVLSQDAPVSTIASFVVEQGRAGAQLLSS